MTAPIVIEVFGEPEPQGNKSGFRTNTGRIVMREGSSAEANTRFKTWRGGVTHAAKEWVKDHDGAEPFDEPVTVSIVFRLTKPSTMPKWRWLPRSRPDIDKLARACLDGISKVIVKDDGRVVELVCRKVYAFGRAPGCVITVAPLGAVEEDAKLAGPDELADRFAAEVIDRG